MVYVKWVFWGVFWTVLIAFLHYTLPQHDVVRITDTYEKRVNPGDNALFWSNADTGDDPTATERDVFFIQAFRANDKPMIYRNEDTGWGWPPYFKFDTSNLQAEASDMISKKSAENAQWVVVRHYGWRNELFSIYPNAVSIRAATGPDEQIIPWVKIVILVLLAATFWAIRVRWKRFRRRRVEPVMDEWSEGAR
ncbi:hypothetical protein RA2_01102 [Roseovarius sp. A-2]|uniref:DUF1523 family protein n=1 Tax=Roseovarius sp. A-2 TaxID=1570360 RepID=UPI0009B53B8E|nr:DUF1523 family protein [Roseovarius sp. A-2]GAW34057.1 hypothetical protein RA2_01102 [Roseovarius sp. A-2]